MRKIAKFHANQKQLRAIARNGITIGNPNLYNLFHRNIHSEEGRGSVNFPPLMIRGEEKGKKGNGPPRIFQNIKQRVLRRLNA